MNTAGPPIGRVTVLGAINVDFVVTADRLPGPGETVVGPALSVHGGGKGANASVAAARVGATVRFLGAVGEDDTAAVAERELREDGVDCDSILRLAGHATGAALIVVDPAGENQIAVGGGANMALPAAAIAERLERWLSDTDCLLVSTEIPGEVVASALRSAARAGVRCVLNPAPPIAAVAETLDLRPLLTPNAGELNALLKILGDEASDDIKQNARRLQQRSGAPVVVTLGGDGALIVDDTGDCTRVPPSAAEVRDTTGAGDTFNGVLAAYLAGGASLGEAVHVANLAGALSVAHVGARAGMPRGAALRAALRGAVAR